jgi:epoxyqueuosine reductase
MTTSTSELTGDWIVGRARDLGFDVCGVTGVTEPWPAAARLAHFLELGRQGDMDWMSDTAGRRAHPRALWPEARSAIVLGLNYGPDSDPLAHLARRDRGTISVYAQGRDYHAVIKGRLKTLAGQLARRGGGEVKVFVDTAPLMEKPLAAQAGLGWQGKHTNLVSRAFGSWLFLGVILISLDLVSDAPAEDHCGACRACLDICPTQAFPAPYQLDARRCLSYLTIEHSGPIPVEFRAALGNRIYGCDDCLAVCPWNKFASSSRESALHAREALRSPALADLVGLDDVAFRQMFSGSPIKRLGRDRFVRNVLYAIGNSGDRRLLDAARGRLEDPCDMVRDAAAWALARLPN